MGKPQRFTKLGVPWDRTLGNITTRNTLVGAEVIGDYYDAANEQRVLVFERPEPPQAPKPKPQGKRTRRTRAQIEADARQAQANAAAQGVGVTHGQD